MSDGIGEGRTREDHQDLSSQLYALYAQAKRVERLASIIGEEDLTARDGLFLKFSKAFEERFIKQGPDEDRTVFETLQLGWDLVMMLPPRDLTRVKPEEIQKYGLKTEGSKLPETTPPEPSNRG
jgi:V/A-type H+-transporting ATPase subunit B